MVKIIISNHNSLDKRNPAGGNSNLSLTLMSLRFITNTNVLLSPFSKIFSDLDVEVISKPDYLIVLNIFLITQNLSPLTL
jgi:hypothetical protein